MSDRIRLAKGLSLRAEDMLQRFAILAMSGAGKSNVAALMCEGMYPRVPWTVIDPKGDWWGLRSSKSGKSAGLDVPIFGGLHADIPLYEDGGAVMADAVANELTHSIIDVSEFETKAAMLRFLTDFAERLYRVNKTPIVVVLEEADEFIPQKTNSPAEAKSVGVWSRVQKRGRTRGIFTVLIAQRIAELAKAVLNQSDTVIAMRATAKLDRDAIKGWIEYADAAREILDSLSTLDDGHGWFASPQKLKRTELVTFDRRHTFDSGSTPSLDGSREAVKLASIDLSAIGQRMQDTIERAKEEDPEELRKQIKELRATVTKLEAREPEPVAAAEPELVPVPVLDEPEMERLRSMLHTIDTDVSKLPTLFNDLLSGINGALDEGVRAALDRAENLVAQSNGGARATRPSTPATGRATRPGAAIPPPPRPAPPSTETAPDPDNEGPTRPQQKVLDAIYWLEQVGFPAPSKVQVGFIAGYRTGKKVGGTYGNILGQLRSAGWIDYPAPAVVSLTATGRGRATDPGIERTSVGLQRAVMERLTVPEQRVLTPLIERYPDALPKKDVGEDAGYSVGEKIGGTFGNILGKLRTLGLIDYPSTGMAVATPVLFID